MIIPDLDGKILHNDQIPHEIIVTAVRHVEGGTPISSDPKTINFQVECLAPVTITIIETPIASTTVTFDSANPDVFLLDN